MESDQDLAPQKSWYSAYYHDVQRRDESEKIVRVRRQDATTVIVAAQRYRGVDDVGCLAPATKNPGAACNVVGEWHAARVAPLEEGGKYRLLSRFAPDLGEGTSGNENAPTVCFGRL
jgi:hypothetical protein